MTHCAMRIPINLILTVLLLSLIACGSSSDGNSVADQTSGTDSVNDVSGSLPDVVAIEIADPLDLAGPDLSDAAIEPPDLAQDLAQQNDVALSPDTQIPPCTGQDCPIVISGFPYQNTRTTEQSSRRQFNKYNCAPTKDEGGSEFIYVFEVHEPGTVIASVEDGSGVDIDIHLLTKLDDQECLVRSDKALSYHLQPGVYYFVADTFVSSGVEQPGEYTLRTWFIAENSKCGMKGDNMPRIGTTDLLPMPATGKVVKEAHLLTAEEHQMNLDSGMTHFPSGWPTSFTDRIAEHRSLSEQLSKYVMVRKEPWAPCCEPVNEFGQGSSAKPPMVAETWYINMRWKKAPKRGERYIVFNPYTGEAVVGAAGYENGPGDLEKIGGSSEEIHHYLGTSHLSYLTFGAALDQDLPFGPVKCFSP